MSLSIDKKKGIKLKTSKKAGRILVATLIIIEAVFTFFLYLSLAGKIFAPPKAESVAGVPELISYQGRLTDTSGNPLGGTGTVYCFRYYMYDAASSGNQIWPAGTATDSTTTVTDGVFSDQIGRMDSLATQDFMTTSTLYLQVQANTVTSTCSGSWENLAPRQQITASAWSQTAQNIYGNSIRTNVTRKVQIGAAGAGQSSSTITLLSLDVNNVSGDEGIGGTCSNNGTLWYNSVFTRALVCENGVIQTISNSSTTIAGIKEQSTSTVISSGTVNFSAQANITISQTGNTLGFSVAAPGGGGGQTLSNFVFPLGATSQLGAFSNAVMSIVPFNLGEQLTATRAMMMASISGNTNSSGTYSVSLGLYTRNVSTLSLYSSGSQSFAYASSQTSLAFGMRRFSVPLNLNLTPGDYWYAVWMRSSNNGLVSIMGGGGTTAVFSGNFGIAANSSRQAELGLGIYSNASFSTAMPSSIAITNVKGGTGTTWNRKPWILFTNLDLN